MKTLALLFTALAALCLIALFALWEIGKVIAVWKWIFE